MSLLVSVPTISHGQSFGWSSNLQLPGLGRDDAVAFVVDNIVYVGTGNHSGFAESNKFYAYSLWDGSWSEAPTFPGIARQYSRVEVIGFKAYLIGGIDLFNNPLNDVWEFYPKDGVWTQMNEFPGDERYAAASFQIDDVIYYGSGRNLSTSFNDFWKYNQVNDSWTQLLDIPFSPRFETVSFKVFNTGFIGLGMDCTAVMHDDLWAYNSAIDSWEQKASFPGGNRYYAKAEVLNGSAFVGSGEDESGEMFNDFWRYSPSTDKWNKAENIPSPKRRGVASCAIPFVGIYFACGIDDSYNRLQDISRYTVRNLNPPPISVLINNEAHKLYITDLFNYSIIRIVSLSGELMLESFELIDHLEVDVSTWAKGTYVVWIQGQAEKFVVM